MFLKNKKHSETRSLLEEHIETGQERQERQRTLKYLYFIIGVTTCAVIFGAGLIISTEGDYGYKNQGL